MNLTSTYFIDALYGAKSSLNRLRALLRKTVTLLTPQSAGVNLIILLLTDSLKHASKC